MSLSKQDSVANNITNRFECFLCFGVLGICLTFTGCQSDTELTWTSAISTREVAQCDKLPSFIDQNPDALNSNEAEGMVRWLFFAYANSDKAKIATMTIPECTKATVTFLTNSKTGKRYLYLHIVFSKPASVTWLTKKMDETDIPAFFQVQSENAVSVIVSEE